MFSSTRGYGLHLSEPILGKNFKHPPRSTFQPKLILDKSFPYVSPQKNYFTQTTLRLTYRLIFSSADSHLRSLSHPSAGRDQQAENATAARQEEAHEADPRDGTQMIKEIKNRFKIILVSLYLFLNDFYVPPSPLYV